MVTIFGYKLNTDKPLIPLQLFEIFNAEKGFLKFREAHVTIHSLQKSGRVLNNFE